MQDWIKAFVVFVFMCVLWTFVNEGPFHDRKERVIIVHRTLAPVPATDDEASLESEDEQGDEDLGPDDGVGSIPVAATRPASVPDGEPAVVCASFDPVDHPEQTLDVLAYASYVSGTPIDVLTSIWLNETGVVYGSGGSDLCPVKDQLEIRCKVGGSCSHAAALSLLTKQFNWNENGMRCSCGTATMDVNTHNFGGCCGPFQFSAGEIVKDALARNLDPMTFCGGAVIAGTELKRHHDRLGSWKRAISRYYGRDKNGTYYLHAYQHWVEITPYLQDTAHPERLRAYLTKKASYRLARSRSNRAYNTSAIAFTN